MSSKTPIVSVVILNWNSRQSLQQCIDSVLNQTYASIELVFMDNASTDGSLEWVKQSYPTIKTINNESNLGFARAHNRGIQQTIGDYYMPLNPDVVLSPTFIAEMVKIAIAQDEIGSVMGKLLFMKSSGEKTDTIYSTGHLLTKSRSPTNRGYKRKDIGQFDKEEFIFAANGAAPLYSRVMLEDIAMDSDYFCEDFFIYGDDHDLGWRSQLRGWKCVYTPDAIGFHVGFGSGGIRNFYVQTQFTRNRYLTLVRNDYLQHIILDIPWIIAYEIVWQASRLLSSPKRLLSHWYGIMQALYAIPETLKDRHIIQKHAKVKKQYIRSFFASQLF